MASTPEEKMITLHRSLLSRELEMADVPIDSPAVPRRSIHWPPFGMEEVFRATCQVASTTPGSDEIPATALRMAWPILGPRIVTLFQNCYNKGVHPSVFKQAQVVVLPKSGPRDRSLPKAYRPISLLSCLGKGLERLLARRISFLALRNDILAIDQCSAVSKRSAVDLTTALTCDVQTALDSKSVAGMVTVDIKGAFDGIAKGRLVHRLREQGWPEQLLTWTASFFDHRKANIRLDGQLSQTLDLKCGLPQGSPVSPILFLLYVEPLIKLTKKRFGYADDVALLETGKSLEDVRGRLQKSLDMSLQWGLDNGITFEPSKTELQYFHRKRKYEEPSISMGEHSITPNDSTKWLGITFDRKLQFTEHLRKARIRARQVTDHLRRLCGTSFGASAFLLRQSVQSCAFSTLLYGAETWFSKSTSKHAIGQLQIAMNRGAHAVLPVYKTTPTAVLIRETGWGTADAWLNRIRDRYAVRVAAADSSHPLRRRWDSTRFRWLRQNLDIELAEDTSAMPWIASNRDDLRREIGAVGRQDGPEIFNQWVTENNDPLDITIYSDGSMNDRHEAGAGFVTFRGHGQEQECLDHGIIPLGHSAEVYDAEIAGAVSGLQSAYDNPWSPFQGNVTVILDNEEAAMRLQSGVHSASSWGNLNRFQHLRQVWAQGAFLGGHRQVAIRWCPGHSAVQGNETADALAKLACQGQPPPWVKTTIARAKGKIKEAFCARNEKFWQESAPQRYIDLGIKMPKHAPPELRLPRKHLSRLIAARTGHGDFAAYHERFGHREFVRTCECGREKTPEHFIFCSLGKRRSHIPTPCGTCVPARLKHILGTSGGARSFAKWCETTSFFDDIQKR